MLNNYEVVVYNDNDTEAPGVLVSQELYRIRDKTLDAYLPGFFESFSEASDCCYKLNNDRP
ncbi:hypothetical protein DFO67_12044 [Modicisalibacter xianhensis]|uniref:Uncharacterized protein n=1 Tax=Modicisalibacter xianhensis TaxID=442341 RepID=A0A4R8FFV7_9GAMM|nr:hypothetical protein DFO67_12044 [Halomonas xianhensis]